MISPAPKQYFSKSDPGKNFGTNKMHTSTDEEENVYELKFGGINFDSIQSLTQDEMLFLLNRRKEQGVTNQFFDQTYSYLEKVATVKPGEELQTLTMELGQKLRGLKLQRAQDGKLIPLHAYEEDATVEELLSLVPSLSRFPDDQIEIAINIVIEAKARARGNL